MRALALLIAVLLVVAQDDGLPPDEPTDDPIVGTCV